MAMPTERSTLNSKEYKASEDVVNTINTYWPDIIHNDPVRSNLGCWMSQRDLLKRYRPGMDRLTRLRADATLWALERSIERTTRTDPYEPCEAAQAVISRYAGQRSRISQVELQRDLIRAHRPLMDMATRERADRTIEFLTDVLLGVKEYGINQRPLI